MKKIQHKLRRKNKTEPQVSRITNETVAEHRERILAGGKKFKYPHQYLRHKLVINASIIGVLALVLIIVLGWWQLYVVRNTSDFLYRVTRVVPVPVASVDGKQVRYSDYLMRYRSQELWLRNQGQLGLSDEDSNRQLDFYKRKVMDAVEFDTYAAGRAKELNIVVTDKDVDKVVDANRNTSTGRISQDVYNTSTKTTLGYSPSEYRYILKQSLLRQKAAYAVDTAAKSVADEVSTILEKDKSPDLQKIADALKKKGKNVELGASGLVSRNNHDSGRTAATLKLKDGEVTGPITSVNVDEYGYYFVQRLSANDKQVSYQYIRVPLTVLAKDFATVKSMNNINEYIDLRTVEQRTKDN